MGDSLLGPDGDDRLGIRVDFDAIVSGVPVGDGGAELGNSPGGGIAMGAGILDGFDELFHDVRRGGEVRVPHSQVNDVVPFAPGLHLQVIDDGKDVGRKPLDAIEFFHG